MDQHIIFDNDDSQVARDDCNAVSVVLTSRYIFVGTGRVFDDKEQVYQRSEHIRDKGNAGNARHFEKRSIKVGPLGVLTGECWLIRPKDVPNSNTNQTSPALLKIMANRIRLLAPNVKTLVFSAFGPFTDDTRHYFSDFLEGSPYKAWDSYPIHNGIKQALEECKLTPKIHIELDVKLAALGEQYSPSYVDHSIATLDRVREQRTAYLRVSDTINAGFTSSGWIVREHHPQLSVFYPRKRINEEIVDYFSGCCSRHHDCVEGLIGVKALKKRADVDRFEDISEDSKIWHWVAWYVSQTCHVITSAYSPTNIILGGRTVRAPKAETPRSNFVERVQAYFYEALYSGFDSPSPRYRSIENIEEFLTYRNTKFPSVFGGLLYARFQAIGLQPGRSQPVSINKNAA